MGEKTSPYPKHARRSLPEALAELERVQLEPGPLGDSGVDGDGSARGEAPDKGHGHGNGGDNNAPAGAGAGAVLHDSGLADVPLPPEPEPEPPLDRSQATWSRNTGTFQREYYLRDAARSGLEAAANGGNGSSGEGHTGSPLMNPFSGPGRVHPTLQFVQNAIRARPALTEEIVTAALRISPDQAHKIVLAAIRANPRAKSSILRIARNAGTNGLRLALSLVIAMFLYELFAPTGAAEAHEDDDAFARKLAIPESYIAWFTSAAATLAILFDSDAIARLSTILNLEEQDGTLSFDDIVDRVADRETIDQSLLSDIFAAADEEGGGEAGRASDGPDGTHSNTPFVVGELGQGLRALGPGAVGNDGEQGSSGTTFTTLNLDPSPIGALDSLGGLADELYDPGGGPADPDEESVEPEEPRAEEDKQGENILPSAESTLGVQGGAGEEAGGTVSFTVTRDGDLSSAATVDFATVDGTALAGRDFVATSGTLTFAPGVSEMAVVVELIADFTFEAEEQFAVELSNPGETVIGDGAGSANAVIADSDADNIRWSIEGDQIVDEGGAARYTLSFAGASVGEGQAVSADLRIVLPDAPGGASESDLASSLEQAIRAAIAALSPSSGIAFDGTTITFAHGAPRELSFTLEAIADGLAEGVENFTILLENPSVGAVETGASLVTTAISDGDAEQIRWSLTGDNMVAEGQQAAYAIAYDGPSLAEGEALSIVVDIDLPGGPDGAEGSDFGMTVLNSIRAAIDALGPNSGIDLDGNVLTFAASAPRRLEFELDVRADTIAELPEGFSIGLSEPSFGAIAEGQDRKVTIIDDTSLQNLSWSLTGDLLVREGGAPSYTVSYSGVTLAAGVAVAVDLAINLPGGNGGADAGDFKRSFLADVQRAVDALGPDSGIVLDGSTLIFTEGAPNSLTFGLETVDDEIFENVENFTVLLRNASDGEIQAGRHLVTTAIMDDERPNEIASANGTDAIDVGPASDDIQAFDGDERATADSGSNLLNGTADGDIIAGESGNDVIMGYLGDDVLSGGGGNDILVGGPGLDRIDGGPGDDLLSGNAGEDILTGGPGADRFEISAKDVEEGGADRVLDFNPADGDQIQVLDLLGGLEDTMVDLDEFIRFQERGGDLAVQIDVDGAGARSGFADALIVTSAKGFDLEQMLQDESLLVS